jgi:uncharacterized protein (TIGR03790 family)
MRGMRLLVLSVLSVILVVEDVKALGPHEVLLLANGRSPESIDIADTYARLRGIPEQNILRLNIAREDDGWPHTISPAEFTRLIWRPATRVVQQRGLEDQLLVWVYSTDFPIRISTTPPISIQGITFLRNQLPDSEAVKMGTYHSPLFTGPDNVNIRPHISQTFDTYAEWLRDEMPLPSMMLGYSGKKGNSLDRIRTCLSRGVASDGSSPTGTVYFVQTKDVRSECRQWQHVGATYDINVSGLEVVVTDQEPQGRSNVLGIQMGAANVRPDRNTYLPGSMAEHLTSEAAIFYKDSQTKLTKWIEAGVTASCGTVVEPYNVWTKFPSAYFYYHYTSGCSMIESFYQSIRCPLQILLVGEPLASPWKPALRVSLQDLDSAEIREQVTIRPKVEGIKFARFTYLIDGKRVATGPTFTLDPSELPAGEHRLRIVANGNGLVKVQAFHEETVVVVAPVQ